MPPLPLVPNTMRLQLTYGTSALQIGGSRTFFSYQPGPPPSASQLATIVSGIHSAWSTSMAPMVNTSMQLQAIDLRDLSSATPNEATNTIPIPGTRTGGDLPMNNCVLLNYVLARRYRGGKPRSYVIGGVDTDTTDQRHWTTAFLTAFASAQTAVVQALTLNTAGVTGVAQVNVSYFHGFTVVTNPRTGRSENIPTLRPSPLVDAVALTLVNTIIGSQRRRLRSG